MLEIENVGKIRILAERARMFGIRKDVCKIRDLTPQWVWENRYYRLCQIEKRAGRNRRRLHKGFRNRRLVLRQIKIPGLVCVSGRGKDRTRCRCQSTFQETT